MQIGVRELRGRLSEVVNGNQHVVITNKGRVVGEFMPATIIVPTADRVRWIEERAAFRHRWQSDHPDWVDLLGREGMDEEGVPYNEPTFR